MVTLVRSMTGTHPARPCVVVSNNPEAGGLIRARDMGLPAVAVDHRAFGKDRAAFEAALAEALAPFEADILCLAGFIARADGRFRRGLARPDAEHSPLAPAEIPAGSTPIARAIAAGDTQAGCTVHEVTPALDDGPILGQARVPVLPGDTADTLAARVLEAEHRLYPPAVLRRFAAGDRRPVLLG